MMIYLISVVNEYHYFYDDISGDIFMHDTTTNTHRVLVGDDLCFDNIHSKITFTLPEKIHDFPRLFKDEEERKQILGDLLFEHIVNKL